MSVRMSSEMFGTPFWITHQPLRVIWGVSWSSAWLMIALSFLVHTWGHIAWVDSGDCSLELWRYYVTPPGNLVGSSQAEWRASVGPPMVAGDPACVPSAAPPQTQTVSVISRCRPYLLCFFVFPWKNSKLAIPTQTRGCLGVKELNVIWIALFSMTLKSWHAPWASQLSLVNWHLWYKCHFKSLCAVLYFIIHWRRNFYWQLCVSSF